MSDETDDNDENNLNWQVFTSPKRKNNNKRKIEESPNAHLRKKPTTNELQQQLDVTPSTSKSMTNNNNSFASLAVEDEVGENNNINNVEPKPPQIVIPNVANVKAMVTNFCTIIPAAQFNYKTMNDGQIKVMTKSVESYRKLVTYLNNKSHCFHTYQLKQERSQRVVLKNLHYTTPLDDIKQGLESLGFKVRNVSNIRRRNTKEPLPMFYIDLEPNDDNQRIYELKFFNHAVVKIEAPNKSRDLPQCHRCQEFGHTKTYCRKLVKCVKCGLGHLTVDCTKAQETAPKCINCLGNHPANYKGCLVYQQLLKRKLNNAISNKNSNNGQRNYLFNETDYPQLHNNSNLLNNNNLSNNRQSNENNSYSDAVRNSNSSSKLEYLLQTQIDLTNKLLSMITVLLTKLCK